MHSGSSPDDLTLFRARLRTMWYSSCVGTKLSGFFLSFKFFTSVVFSCEWSHAFFRDCIQNTDRERTPVNLGFKQSQFSRIEVERHAVFALLGGGDRLHLTALSSYPLVYPKAPICAMLSSRRTPRSMAMRSKTMKSARRRTVLRMLPMV